MPANPALAAKVPGGSSSGAAVAMAANLVDFALGWFARDPNLLRLVGHILMQVPCIFQLNPRQIIKADDCFQQLNDPLDRSSLLVVKSAEKLFGKLSSLETNGELKVSSLKSLASIMQFLQRHEFRLVNEEWINAVKPYLHPAVSADLYEKFELSDVEVEHFKSIRNEMRAAIRSLLKVRILHHCAS
ncbi:hypothetical protein PIB30_013883 [Stylosanthes scabra]|uniref:Uncharacterized protein n=1 Tax=Stylosanthes scabra TaxID=79078 RepID=A0ABU6V9U0_9FABA|nr:hypothetical protein [Stylosanthes scabra]